MRRLHYLQHVPFENMGTIHAWAESNGMQVHGTRFYKCEPLPSVEEFDWLIIMGGPMGVSDELLYPWLRQEKKLIRQALEDQKVVLGICLGAQLIADVLGARVQPNFYREVGWFPVYKTATSGHSSVSAAIPDGLQVLHWHGETFDLPQGTVHLGYSEACKNQGFLLDDRIVGLQFHLEMTARNLERLIKNCRNEIDESRYVQTPEMMLSGRERFASANAAMDKLLNCLLDLDH